MQLHAEKFDKELLIYVGGAGVQECRGARGAGVQGGTCWQLLFICCVWLFGQLVLIATYFRLKLICVLNVVIVVFAPMLTLPYSTLPYLEALIPL